MGIDTNLTIRLLIENAGSLPTKTILTQLAMYPKLQVHFVPKFSFYFILFIRI